MSASEDGQPGPTDIVEWQRALDGCARLYARAADHVRAERFFEAARCISVAARTGAQLHLEVAMAYALSQQAVHDRLYGPRPDPAHSGY